jgi:hypothetical protein
MSQAYAKTRQDIVPAKNQAPDGRVYQNLTTGARNPVENDGPTSGKVD